MPFTLTKGINATVKKEDLKKKGRSNSISNAKGLLAYWAYKELKISTKELVKFFNISRYGVLKSIERGKAFVRDNDLKLIS